MVNRIATILLLGLVGLFLAACQKMPWNPPIPEVKPAPPPAAAQATPEKQTAPMNNIDDYKLLVAEQILQANPGIVFRGQLPPLLPAIVVVNISVDKDGELTRVVVQRSRNSNASQVALAAVKRCGVFPKPLHLLHRGHKTFDFSETFLFNSRHHFQLRTLAGPQ